MGVTVQWDNPEKTVIYYLVEDEWDWHDLHRLADLVDTMINQVDHLVDAIADFKTSVTMKQGMLKEGRRLLTHRHSRGGVTVVITANPLFRSIYHMIRLAYPRANLYSDFYFASTVDEARALIHKMRQGQHPEKEGLQGL